MKVQQVPLKSIVVKDRARIDLGDIKGLAESIEKHGLLQPITVDEKMNLLAGGRRYAAHEYLGWLTVDVVIKPIKGKVDALEIELIENIHRKDLKWPERANLEKKIADHYASQGTAKSQRAQAAERGVSPNTINRRIQLAEAMELIPELAEHATEDEAWKEYKRLEEGEAVKMMMEKAPAYIIGARDTASKDYNVGDAFVGLAKEPDETYDFAEVDPPYGVALDKRKSRNKGGEQQMGEYHEWDDFQALFYKTVAETYRVLKPDTFAVFWYGMSWHTEVLETIREVGFGVPDIPAIWVKRGGGQTASPDTTLGSNYEPFFLARKGKPVLVKPGRANIFDFQPMTKKVHPTEKPIPLLTEIFNTCCFPHSNVIIPFLGSGVSLRACYALGHTGKGWDLSQEHKNGFLQRVAEDAAKKGE
jgi:ParB family chromosome partitioning protein